MNEPRSLHERLGGRAGLLALITPFYADVRRHAVLGPIFNAHISDWPAHLDKVARFWAQQTGGDSDYRGGFAAAHLPLRLRAEHFDGWLGLWEFNCRRQLQEPEAGELIALARRLGERLARVVAGKSALTIEPG